MNENTPTCEEHGCPMELHDMGAGPVYICPRCVQETNERYFGPDAIKPRSIEKNKPRP